MAKLIDMIKHTKYKKIYTEAVLQCLVFRLSLSSLYVLIMKTQSHRNLYQIQETVLYVVSYSKLYSVTKVNIFRLKMTSIKLRV